MDICNFEKFPWDNTQTPLKRGKNKEGRGRTRKWKEGKIER
jgi:hypothetical protein